MNSHSEELEKDPPYGWLMVFIVFSLSALSFGVVGSISVFLKPLSAEFGWGRGDTSLGYTAAAFSSALFGVLWGFVADKFGTRWFGVVAAFTMAITLYLMSTQSSLFEFYLYYFLFGALGNALASTPLFANVGFWFRHNPGLAIGVTASGGAVGQGIVPYCVGLSLDAHGWQSTYIIMAGVYLAIALPLGLLVRESPWRQRARLEGTVEERTFPLSEIEVVVWISVAVIFCCNCMSVPIVHLVPLLTDDGFTLSSATSVLMVLMFSGAVGRITGGKLGDMIGALPTYILMSAGQTFFVFWFPHVEGMTNLYILAILFGFTYSGVMSSILVCTRMMVGANFAARAMSITSFFGWTGMGLGGFFGGKLFDIYGNYDLSFAFASAMGVINLVILTGFFFRIRSRRQSAEPAVA